jgi:hypothetical protein
MNTISAPGFNNALVNMISAPGNQVAAMVADSHLLGTDPMTYAAYNLYTWNSAGPVDRRILGGYLHGAPSDFTDQSFSNSSLSFAGDSFFAWLPSSMGGADLYPGKYRPGGDDSYKGKEDTTLTVDAAKSVLLNDPNHFSLLPLTAVATSTSPGIESLVFNSDGTFSVTPVANFNGIATFQYEVIQAGSPIDTFTVTIDFKSVNDAPSAVNDEYTVAMNSAETELMVLDNDTDGDGDALKIIAKSGDGNAKITLTAAKDRIVFKPKKNFSGDTTFTYTVKDPSGATSTATVTVHVTP